MPSSKFFGLINEWTENNARKLSVKNRLFGEAFDEAATIEFPRVFNSHQLEKAKLLHIRNAQEQSFLEEMHALKKGEHTKISSKLLTFTPFLDDNVVYRLLIIFRRITSIFL